MTTSLYPNAVKPRHGIFVETRLRQVLATGHVEAAVIAPVPWFPFRSARFGAYGDYARVPVQEARYGIDVAHPRYFMLPLLGMRLQPLAMAGALERAILRRRRESGADFDLIDAHYFYPDGVAAAHVARRLDKPLVITARGSDINLIATLAGPGRAILEAAATASEIIAVSRALADRMESLGIPGSRITVLRNGVDAKLFRPTPRAEARQALGLPQSGLLLASVGNLRPEKGHELAIRSLRHLPDARLLIVGDGPDEAVLRRCVQEEGLGDRVHWSEPMAQDRLRLAYAAADVLLLCSAREGWPNVLLESLACGTPVVASDVGGVSEIVDPSVGRLVSERTPAAFADAVRDLLRTPVEAAAAVAYARRFDWTTIADGQVEVYRRASGRTPVTLPTGSRTAHPDTVRESS